MKRPGRFTQVIGWCALAWLVGMWFAIYVFGDRVWWTVPLVFGPRWALALPWFGFVPWLVVAPRRAGIPAIAGLLIAVFVLMGFRVGLHRASTDSGFPLRVLELNAGGTLGPLHAREIFAELEAQRPDLIVVAECATALSQALAGVPGYHFRAGADLCMLSRGDIVEWVSRDQMAAWRRGGSGAIIRATVATPAGNLRVGLVHLATPRNALDRYGDLSNLLRQGPSTQENIAERDDESGDARAWIMNGAQGPTIVVGDFNLPIESAIYRRHWGSFRNAFGRAGTGFGYTKHMRAWGVRIDHVLMSSDIGAHGVFVGHDVGSDHLPLIADLILPSLQTSGAGR